MLDFEKPILQLEEKLAVMKHKASKKNSKISEAQIQKLEEEIKSLQIRTFKNLTNWQRVQLSRHPLRPYTLDYIGGMCTSFIQLHGDRVSSEDKAMVCGIGDLEGQSIFFIGQQKGRNTKDRQERNFGMANPQGYRKALRIMKLAEKFGKPIVTLIDTPGAFPGMEAEENGQAEAIAKNIQSMFDIRVPIICIIIGEGASGGALGIGVGDKVLMLENTWYSVISPESCSSILWKSWDYKEKAAEMLKLTAQDMLSYGLIDGIIPEPIGAAHRNTKEAFSIVKLEILKHLNSLKSIPIDQLLEARMKRFVDIGVVGNT
jgi:acetyl-CoA carboxylase carboxyl transferase subunit alpha